MEKLNKQVDNVGHWFNARSALSMSIVAQKLGLFNHQPFYRKQKKVRGKNTNPFLGKFIFIQWLRKLPRSIWKNRTQFISEDMK